MKVIVKEKEFNYFSDYPDGWMFSSGDSFKFPVLLGNYKCFVKRFEKKKPENISGWKLLNHLKGKFEPNLPRIYDIVCTEEKSKNIYYIFFEYLQGSTLDALIAQNYDINLQRITDDLFNALRSLHKHNYWFPDFIEKNIFLNENGKSLLIDVDSAQPVSETPHNALYGDKEYWALVFTFYKEILSYKELKLADLNGAVLNYLQLIFLILRIKIAFIDKTFEYKSEEMYNTLPLSLNNIDSGFKNLFERALDGSVIADYTTWSHEVKDIIFRKIIDNSSEPAEVKDYPLIKFFKATTLDEENVKAFSLHWELENATDIEVHRNGTLYKKLNAEERSLAVNEFYDGKKKEVLYTLLVSNSNGTVESEPLTITLTDDEPVIAIAETEPNINESEQNFIETEKVKKDGAEENKDELKKKKFTRIMLAASLLIMFVTVFFIINPLRHRVSIAIFKSEVYEGNTLLIFGYNLPKDSNNVEIYFNKVKSDIIQYSQKSIQVAVPAIAGQNRKVKVAVVIKGDTTYAANDLIVRESTKIDSAYAVMVEDTTVTKHPSVRDSSKPGNSGKNTGKGKDKTNNKGKDKTTITKPKPPKSIYDLVSARASSSDRNNNVKITVRNHSKYNLDLVNVTISYLNNDGYELKREIISLKNVEANSNATVIVSEPDNVKTVDPKVNLVKSAQFDSDSKQSQ